MVDRIESNVLIGRTEFDSPEVDNEVIINSRNAAAVGEIINVKITDANVYDLIGEIKPGNK